MLPKFRLLAVVSLSLVSPANSMSLTEEFAHFRETPPSQEFNETVAGFLAEKKS